MRSKAVSGYSILTRLVHLVGQLWWILGCNTWSLFFGTKKSLPHAGSVGYWPHPKLNAFPGFPLNLRKLSHPSFHSLSPGVAPMQWLLNEKSPISLLSVGVNCEGPSQLQRSPGVQRKQKAPASQFTSSLCSFELFFTVSQVVLPKSLPSKLPPFRFPLHSLLPGKTNLWHLSCASVDLDLGRL